MLKHSVSYYLPSFWATTPLYSEKIIPLLDTFLSVGSPYADKLALAYYDIWNKYTRTEEMTDESIRAFIRDSGYGYILNLLDDSSETLQELILLLPVIAMLKDSKQGLETVLTILKSGDKPVEISEWWETNVVEDEDTFDVDCSVDINKIGDNFLDEFGVFIQKYVHPMLRSIKITYTITGAFTLLPVVSIFDTLNLKSKEDMDLAEDVENNDG